MTSPVIASRERLLGLHALRLFAALPVFALHMAVFVPLQPPVPMELVRNFTLGVQLFYVLSAFALMHSVRLDADRPGWIGRFYLKRLFRIAPLFYVMMAVAMAYRAFLGEPASSAAEIAANIFFVFNFWPGFADAIPFAGWSIGVEMLFYLLFPLLFVAVRSIRAGVMLALGAIVVGLAGRFYFSAVVLPPFATYADFSFVSNFPAFAFGILAFLVYDRLRQTGWFTSAAAALPLHLIFASLTAGLVGVIVTFEEALRDALRFDVVLWGLVFAVASVWVALRPLPGLGWAPIQFLGERSYSLYLVHPIIVFLTAPAAVAVSAALEADFGFLATLAAAIMVWLVVVAASSVTYALIERPGMNLGKWILRTSRQPARAAAESRA